MSRHFVIGRSWPPHRRPPQSAHISNILAASFFASASLLALMPAVATAADMPVKAQPMPGHNWTGCYVGLNGGGAASGSNFTSGVDAGTHLADPGDVAAVAASGTGSANDSNFIAGGQVGCNLQTGALVFGLEGDWDYFHSNATFTSQGTLPSTGDAFSVTQSMKTSSLATVRPRLGIVSDRTLIYVTVGAAFAKVSYAQSYADSTATPAIGGATGSATLTGWAAGAGWEKAWTESWSVKVEYLFAKFPTTNAVGAIVDTAVGANVLRGSADLTIQSVRLGLNYKF
jgi:outer membrane immunogenic protein